MIRGEIVLIFEEPACQPPLVFLDGDCQDPGVAGPGTKDDIDGTDTGATARTTTSDTETPKTTDDPDIFITIAPDDLRDGRQRVDYGREVLTASGGTRPYRYDITQGTLPPGLDLSLEGALTGTPTQTGSFEFEVTATDWDKNAGQRSYLIEITAPGSVRAPPSVDIIVIESCPPEELLDDGTCNRGGFGTSVAETDSSSGTKTTETTDTPLVVDTSPASVVLTILPPTLRPGRVRIDYGREILTATGGNAPYIFGQSDGRLPQGLALSRDGALTGTPLSTGVFGFTVAVQDRDGVWGYRGYSIEVSEPGSVKAPPAQDTKVISSCPPERLKDDGTCEDAVEKTPVDPLSISPDAFATGVVGVPYGPVEIILTGGETPYTIVATTNLPQGLTMSDLASENGVSLSGTPTEAFQSDQALIVNAIDALGSPLVKTYGLSVTEPLAILPDALPPGKVGEAYGPFDVTATGGVPPYQTRVENTGLPLDVNVFDGVVAPGVQVNGVPRSVGVYENALLYTVIDSTGAVAARSYNLEIVAASCPDSRMFRLAGRCVCPEGMLEGGGTCLEPIELSPLELADGTVNVPYLPVQFVASGTGPFTFEVKEEDGGLPEGMTLSQAGRLSGTPTSSGPHGFVVEVLRGGAVVKSQVYTLQIVDVQIDILPSELPGANVAELYSYDIEALGGSAPYSFSYAGAGPGWLGLSTTGTLSGVPEAEGEVRFAITATDSNGNRSQNVSFLIDVGAEICPFPGMIASLNPDTANACECKPTLFSFAQGQGCGPCEDGQKPFGGICPEPVKPVTQAPVQTKSNCTGGMVLESNGVCGCPSSKPKIVNGVCKAKPKKPAAQTRGSPKCKPGERAFSSEAALRAHLKSMGGGEGRKVSSGSKTIFCGPAGTVQPPTPPVRDNPPPQPQPQQCDVDLGTILCFGYGYTFNASICDCGVPLQSSGNDGDFNDNSNPQPLSCEQNCANNYGRGTEDYEGCFYEQCGG